MTFRRPTLSELVERARADIESRLPGADSRLGHSVLDVIARTHAGALAGLYGYSDHIARQVLPDTADGETLARHASIWGIARKAAIPASGIVRFSGIDGTVIPAATQIGRTDGARYATLAGATIAAGFADVAFAAIEAGPVATVAPGAQLVTANALPGVQANVTVLADDLISGVAEEDDTSLLDRLLTRIRKPPEGGSTSDYVRWARDVPGVTRAWAYPEWMGAGSIGVAFVMDGKPDTILPTEAEIEAVRAYIDPLRPVTAQLIVFAPVALPLDLRIALAPDDQPVRDAVIDELKDLFSRDAAPGGTIYRSRLVEAISLAVGEHNHRLDQPDGDITAEAAFMPMLGEVTFI